MTTDQVVCTILLALGFVLICRLFRCAHAWELVDKTEFESLAELAKKVGHTVNNVAGLETIKELFGKTVWIVIRCPKCGAAKTIKLEG